MNNEELEGDGDDKELWPSIISWARNEIILKANEFMNNETNNRKQAGRQARERERQRHTPDLLTLTKGACAFFRPSSSWSTVFLPPKHQHHI